MQQSVLTKTKTQGGYVPYLLRCHHLSTSETDCFVLVALALPGKNAHAKGTETSEDKQEILRSPDAWAEMDSQNQLTSDGETCWVRFV